MKTHLKGMLFVSTIITLTILSCKKEISSPANPSEGKQIPGMPCLPSNLTSGIIAAYTFSNGSLNDFSGNNNHLLNTTLAHSAIDRAGNPNCAFEFNGLDTSNEFLTTSNTTFLNGLSQFSISLWYQPLDTTRAASDFEV